MVTEFPARVQLTTGDPENVPPTTEVIAKLENCGPMFDR
jgi:hypothetical protein